MMKLKILIHLTILLLLNPIARSDDQWEWVGFDPKISNYEEALKNYWTSEEVKWNLLPKKKDLKIVRNLMSLKSEAHSVPGVIQINKFTNSEDIFSVLKHEITHQILWAHCPSWQSEKMHEFFAYWQSGDYRRWSVNQTETMTKAEARKILLEQNPDKSLLSLAVLRWLVELDGKGGFDLVQKWFFEAFRKCDGPKEDLKNLTSSFDSLVLGIKINSEKKDGFLVYDSLANEVVNAQGDWNSQRAVGSVLKPILALALSNESINKGTGDVWNCKPSDKKKWNMVQALAQSCNGYFLNSHWKSFKKKTELENLYQYIFQTAYDVKKMNRADLIGLWPGIKLSLLDLAKAYDYIFEQDPIILDNLNGVLEHGTLSASKEASWFLKNNFAVKSGSVTDFDLNLESGYLVAIEKSLEAPKIYVIFEDGVKPVDLLEKLKSKILFSWTNQYKKTIVQIGSTLDPGSFRVECPTHLISFKSKNEKSIMLNSEIINLRKTGVYKCLSAPWNLVVNDGKNRKLFGDIVLSKSSFSEAITSDELKFLNPHRTKTAKARRGSNIALITSDQHYLRNVFFSEASTINKKELKKALLWVIESNLNFYKNKNKVICDTTLCQTFNLNYSDVSLKQKMDIDKLITEARSLKLDNSYWYEFSLGGHSNWQMEIDNEKMKSYFLRYANDKNANLSEQDINQKLKNYCDQAMSFFQWPSCPNKITKTENNIWIVEGEGEGHGRGLSIIEGNSLANQGYTQKEILKYFFNSNF